MKKVLWLLISCFVFITGCALKHMPDDSPVLDRMIGQMVMVGFRGLEVSDNSFIVNDIKNAGVGGVILFNKDVALNSTVRNIVGPEQLRQLTAALQGYADIPLFVAVDQEGGIIRRLTPEMGFPSTLSAAEMGNSGDAESAFRAGRITGATLSSVGINMDFAPVVDVNRNPANPVIAALQRSFSDDPEIVASFAGRFIDGLHSERRISCIKHFPGHGSSEGDSHKGYTDVSGTWSSKELYPFQALIGSGKVDMVMTAHIFNEHLDRNHPATLSRKVITGLLRRKMGFNGVIVTDDLQMGAVSNQYGFKKAVEMAVKAGADILLFGNNLTYEPELGTRAAATLKQLVAEGRITERRIVSSYNRIMALKKRYGLLQ